jgi:hypothetical protein
MSETPDEITLPADTVAVLMADPALMREMEQVSEQGTVELIAWLDAHGLHWRPGGSDPVTAFAEAATHGGLEVGGPLFETSPGDTSADRVEQRRKAARKAARRARRATRRH